MQSRGPKYDRNMPLDIKALGSFETSGATQLASCYVPEDVNSQKQGCEVFQY